MHLVETDAVKLTELTDAELMFLGMTMKERLQGAVSKAKRRAKSLVDFVQDAMGKVDIESIRNMA